MTITHKGREGQRRRRKIQHGDGKRRTLKNVGVIAASRNKETTHPSLSSTLSKLATEGIVRARLLSYDPTEISAAAAALGPSSRIAVSVPDPEVPAAGNSMEYATHFCQQIGAFVQSKTVDLVVIGTTPPSGVGADVFRTQSLANATQNVAAACAASNATVAVSTSFSLSVLRSSFPPSASLFAAPGPLYPILEHLRRTRAPFVIELDPYLAWRQSYYDISLDYATFGSSQPVFFDHGFAYWNLYDAMVDAVRWALFQESFGDLDVVVGSVGWPSGALQASPGATPAQAADFNSRLAAHLNCSKTAVPGVALDRDACVRYSIAYIYMADDSETGPDRLLWGICSYPSGEPKYSLATGNVLLPMLQPLKDKSFACAKCSPIQTAALLLALAAFVAALLAALFLPFKRSRPHNFFTRHSADNVATIIRSTRYAAQENLEAARATSLTNHHQKTLSARFYLGKSCSQLRAIDEVGPSSPMDSDESASVTQPDHATHYGADGHHGPHNSFNGHRRPDREI